MAAGMPRMTMGADGRWFLYGQWRQCALQQYPRFRRKLSDSTIFPPSME